VKAELAGKTLRCRDCGELHMVLGPNHLRKRVPVQPNPAQVAGGMRQTPTVISFHCPGCLKEYRVPSDSAGRRVKCSACGEEVVVPSQAPARARAVSHRKALRAGSIVLWAVGALLLLAAVLVNHNLNDEDDRQGRIDDAKSRFDIALGDLTGHYPTEYRATPKSDRTPVYLLAGLGVVCLGLGTVCWVVETQGRADGRGQSPHPAEASGEAIQRGSWPPRHSASCTVLGVVVLVGVLLVALWMSTW
jgi:ribosomal protein S27E